MVAWAFAIHDRFRSFAPQDDDAVQPRLKAAYGTAARLWP
jgi:hypothetical protein